MKPRTQIYSIVGVLISLFALWWAPPAAAQRFPDPTPFAVPSLRMPARGGLFYLQSGLRYRNIQTVRMNSVPHDLEHRIEGIPAFGPNKAGNFGTGTGVPGFPRGVSDGTGSCAVIGPLPTYTLTQDPDCSGIWFYENGVVGARSPQNHVNVTDGTFVYPDDQNYDPDSPGSVLGHLYAPDYPEGNIDGLNIGYWKVDDTATQFNGESLETTTTVSFFGIIDNQYDTKLRRYPPDTDATFSVAGSGQVESRIWKAPGIQFANREFSAEVWTPAFEFGMMATDYFDVFYGFSFFNLSRNFLKSQEKDGVFYRRIFTDTFPFHSSGEGTVPALNSVGVVGGQQDRNYYLWPDGAAQGIFPNRTFSDKVAYDEDYPTARFKVDLTHRVDLETYENRFGFRSWFPVYGLGRVGFSMGTVLSCVYYRVTGARKAISIDALGPDTPAGTVAGAEAHSLAEWWFNWGGFAGMDMSIEYRGFFGQASADWSLCEDESVQLMSVETEYNPGGFSVGFMGGVRF